MGSSGSRSRPAAAAWLLAIVLVIPGVAPAAVAAAQPPETVGRVPAARTGDLTPVTVLVRYRVGTDAIIRSATRATAGVVRVGAVGQTRTEVVRPSNGQSVDQAVEALRAAPTVASAEPNLRRQVVGNPTQEPYFDDYQWGLENDGAGCIPGYATACSADVDIDAAGAWPTHTGAGIVVAVLDDGVDFSHPDLVGQAWVNPGESGDDGFGGNRETNGEDDDGNGYVDDIHGANLCAAAGPDKELHDPGEDWHGTAVASVVAASADGQGIAGVAPNARIMGVRWLVGSHLACTQDDVAAAAIRYAVDNGADVINASWGGEGMTSELAAAIQYASTNNVLFVAAAGNESTSSRFYPAAYDAPNVVSVGAIAPNGSRSAFSNYGTWVDVAAPGSLILGAWVVPGDEVCPDLYCYVDGTSFAAPHVAGIAALAAEANPALLASAAAMRSKVIASGWKNSRIANGVTGYGRVTDARYAVDVTSPAPPSYVSARARSGSTIGTTSSSHTLSWGAATDATGIEYYRVRYRKVGATAWTTLVAQTTARTATATLALGSAYELEVMARDRGANTAATLVTVAPTRYEESSSRWTYGGTWASHALAGFSGGKARYTGTAGRWAQLALTGRSVALVMPKGPTRGNANVYVDGAWKATLNLYASGTSYRSVVWSMAWGTPGAHTIRVVVKGTSGHPRVDVDAAIVAR